MDPSVVPAIAAGTLVVIAFSAIVLALRSAAHQRALALAEAEARAR
jgi:hypothetical protein